MCGIAGSINTQLIQNKILQTMGHRGFDGFGYATCDSVHFYHLRLAIQDVATGQQPMFYKSRYSIVFNGEIYNHQDLRKKFGLSCNTQSDTETILHLFDILGVKMLDEFDGMFALAIYDEEKKQVFLARDRSGKKPLYIYQNNKTFAFASELNCLKAHFPLQIDEDNIFQYLHLGLLYKNNTPYKEISDFPAGCFAYVDTVTLEFKIHQWWTINDFYAKKSEDSFEEALSKTDILLNQAVQRRIEASDLEVGSFLSGGIDSGLVTAIASKYSNKLKTFTVSFPNTYDEAPLAKLVAQRYNTIHTEITINFDNLLNDVEKIICNYGEPFSDSSAIPSYYVSQAAKQHLTVILNGDGGDELFGGYRRYIPFAKYDFFKGSPFLSKVASMLDTILPNPNNKQSYYNFFYRLLQLSSKKGANTYLSTTTDIFEGYSNNILGKGSLSVFEEDFEQIAKQKNLSGLQKLLILDFQTILFGDLLVKMDIATMQHSLEGRSPLLSKELLEYVPSISDKFKIHGTQTKYLLRTLAKKYLPEELINQPKRGFEIPLKSWVDSTLKNIIGDYLNIANPYYSNFVHRDFVNKLWMNKISISAEKRAKILWTIFCLEVWYQKNYKHNI